jgi:hypothetical protein
MKAMTKIVAVWYLQDFHFGGCFFRPMHPLKMKAVTRIVALWYLPDFHFGLCFSNPMHPGLNQSRWHLGRRCLNQSRWHLGRHPMWLVHCLLHLQESLLASYQSHQSPPSR